MKNKRRPFFTFMLAALLACLFSTTALADSRTVKAGASTSGTGGDIKLKKVTYDYENDQDDDDDKYDNEIEVEFSSKVSWKKNARITSVKDNKGKSYKGYLNDRDDDECDIYIRNIKENRTYTIVIDGIKKRGTAGYRKLTLKVSIPSENKGGQNNKALKIKEIKFDGDDDDDRYENEIDIKFNTKVSWRNNAKVSSIKDDKGKTYKGYLNDKDDDECEVYIRGLKYGRTYTIKITGVKARGASSWQTVTAKIKIPAADNAAPRVKKAEYDCDHDDNEYKVKFDFAKDVSFKGNAYVIIKDKAGRAYSSKSSHLEKDDDDCEVTLSRPLQNGQKYTYEIVGVKQKKGNKYTTLKGSFTAYCDDADDDTDDDDGDDD